MYRSYSYNNMPKVITHSKERPPSPVKKEEPRSEVPQEIRKPPPADKKEKSNSFLDNLQTDDIILIMVVIALLIDDCDDKLLLVALAFIFLSDFIAPQN